MKITKQEVEHVAHLARLEFQEQEKEKLTGQLNGILTYMDKLNEIDTKGVEPMTHATFMVNVFRDDEVRPSLGSAAALSNAPDASGSCFRVPKVIE